MGPVPDTRTLQFIDRWIGMIVCWFLSRIRALEDLLRHQDFTGKPSRILFVKFAEQGSTVLAFRAIERAKAMVGAENVYFLVFQENRFILDVMNLIPKENVITIRHRNLLNLAIEGLVALYRVRRLRIDAAIDLEFFARSSASLTYLTGAKSRVGFHAFFGEGPYRGDLMTHRVLYNPHLHTSQTFLLLVEALEQDPKRLPTFSGRIPDLEMESHQFVPPQGSHDEVRAILRAGGVHVGECRIVLLNPNASDLLPLRKWPAERYVELARRLLERFPEICVVMTGAPDEADKIREVASQVGSERCISLAGKTTLPQLLVLYTLSELLITNDSGPAHFASMTPISVITLFGPETPLLFRALTPRAFPIWAQLPCSPCVSAYNNRQSPCRDNVCMKMITVDKVFEVAVKAYLERQQDSNLTQP